MKCYRVIPDWIKKKNATINPKYKGAKWFQYAATVTLNHEEIKKDSQWISKIKLFTNKCIWKWIDCPSESDD